MERQLLIAIHPEYAADIMNDNKTLEIRTWIPKDYVGWVNVYITKCGRPFKVLYQNNKYGGSVLFPEGWIKEKDFQYNDIINGKVAFRFWFENYDTYKFEDGDYWNADLEKLCLTYDQLYEYGKGRTLYSWHIDKLEIFDRPKELSDFYKIGYQEAMEEVRDYESDLMGFRECMSPETEKHINSSYQEVEDKCQIKKAPQKCMWVETDEEYDEEMEMRE